MKVTGLFCGSKKTIGAKLSPTGIYKSAVERAEVGQLGIVGDVQADARVHGGPEKALHQFSLLSYQKIIQRYPLLHKRLIAGSIGENISANHMNEHNVCIGDIYQFGAITLQVSAPRIPCWKIDAKFAQPGLSQFIALCHLSGWYYRVLEPGEIQVGDQIELTLRLNPQLTVRRFLEIIQLKTLDETTRGVIAFTEGLDPQWRIKLLAK